MASLREVPQPINGRQCDGLDSEDVHNLQENKTYKLCRKCTLNQGKKQHANKLNLEIRYLSQLSKSCMIQKKNGNN